MYYIEKHVILQGLQCVLDQKACYMPIIPMCMKSKGILYAYKGNVYLKIEKHVIHLGF